MSTERVRPTLSFAVEACNARQDCSTTGLCIHELFERTVQERPQAVAAVFREESLTYTSLNERSNRLARYLSQTGVRPETIVGISMAPSFESLIGAMAILKAGGAYLSVPPQTPEKRVQRMLQSCSLILTTKEYGDRLPPELNKVYVDAEQESIQGCGLEDVASGVNLDNMAFVRYTSGSMGYPKGVVNIHRSLTNRLFSDALPDILKTDRCAVNLSLGYGTRVFVPLALGASLIIVPTEEMNDVCRLIDYLEGHAATSLFIVPSLLRQILHSKVALTSRLQSLRAITVGGDLMTPDIIERFAEALPGTLLINAYGSNEVGATASLRIVDTDPNKWRSIGRPVANTQIYIMDEHMSQVPAGVSGEICVASPHLARGYLGDPELTSRQFVNLFPENPGARLYRTGDWGVVLPTGEIEFHGRMDNQVKVRGFRVEVEEVEAVLQQHELVQRAAIQAFANNGEAQLAAFVVPREGRAPSATDLRSYLARHLPSYMIPTRFIFLQSLPVTASGKIDRKNLPVSIADSRIDAPMLGTPTEQLLWDLCRRNIPMESATVSDSLRSLGCDSLSAMRIAVGIEEALGIRIPIERLWEEHSLRALANSIDHLREYAEKRTPITKIPRSGRLPVTRKEFHQLSLELLADAFGTPRLQPRVTFGVTLTGRLDLQALKASLSLLCSRHESLRTSFTPALRLGLMEFTGWEATKKQIRISSPYKKELAFSKQIASEIKLPLHEYTTDNQPNGGEEVNHIIAETVEIAFDYSRAPLMKLALVRIATSEHQLVGCVSHLICDGLSMAVLEREIFSLYTAVREGRVLAGPRLQPVDFAHWEIQSIQKVASGDEVNRWAESLQKYDLRTSNLVFATPEPLRPTLTAGREVLTIEGLGHQHLQRFASRSPFSLYVLFLSAFGMLLHHTSGMDRIRIVVFVANRNHPGMENAIGFFAQSVPFPIDLSIDSSAEELMRRVGNQVAEIRDNENLAALLANATTLAHKARKTSESQVGPKFQDVTFDLRFDRPLESPPDLSVTRLSLPPRREVAFGLRLRVIVRRSEISLVSEYRRDIFQPARIRQMLTSVYHIARDSANDSLLQTSQFASHTEALQAPLDTELFT